MDGGRNIKILQTDKKQFQASRNLPETKTMEAINSGRKIEQYKTARIKTFVELNVLPKQVHETKGRPWKEGMVCENGLLAAQHERLENLGFLG